MSMSYPLKRGVIAVSAALSLLAVATPSLAAFAVPNPGAVIGAFDPPFGPDIPNLGFRGTFELRVLGCDPGVGGGYAFVGGNCTMTVQSLTLNFYNYATNPTGDPNIGSGFFQTYTLGYAGSNFPNAFPTGYIQGGFYDANDQFAGFDTIDSNPFAVVANDTGNGGSGNGGSYIGYQGNMLIYFASGHQPREGFSLSQDPAFLVDCNSRLPGATSSTCDRQDYVSSNPAVVTIITKTRLAVPEPETVPLTLIGVVALVASGWRRKLRLSRHSRRLALTPGE